jgi:hypothetical protein
VYGLLSALAESEIPYPQLDEIVLALDAEGNYLQETSNSSWESDLAALRRLASYLVNSQVFQKLSAESQEWFGQVAQGESCTNAMSAVEKMREKEFYNKMGLHPEEKE